MKPSHEIAHEVIHPVNRELANTIEQTIHEKICNLRENQWQPWCIVLNEKAYLALCYSLNRHEYHLRGGSIIDLEYYRDIIVMLDMDASDDVKVLRRPYEELAYPIGR